MTEADDDRLLEGEPRRPRQHHRAEQRLVLVEPRPVAAALGHHSQEDLLGEVDGALGDGEGNPVARQRDWMSIEDVVNF